MKQQARLYHLNVDSANVRASTDDFIAEQTKITTGVKHGIRDTLKKSGLSAEFAFADKKVSDIARTFQFYATPRALEKIKQVPGVANVERATASMHPLRKAL